MWTRRLFQLYTSLLANIKDSGYERVNGYFNFATLIQFNFTTIKLRPPNTAMIKNEAPPLARRRNIIIKYYCVDYYLFYWWVVVGCLLSGSSKNDDVDDHNDETIWGLTE